MDDDNDDDYKKLNLEGCRVVGVDPGRKDLFVAVDQDEEITKCSTKEYYEIARFRKTREKREVWMNNNKYIQAIVRGKRKIDQSIDQSINQSIKICIIVSFQVCQHLLFLQSVVFKYNISPKYFFTWMIYSISIKKNGGEGQDGKQKAMDKLCKRITNNEDKTVVASE